MSMNRIRGSLIALAVLAMPGSLLAEEWTVSQALARVKYDASSDSLYFVGAAGWGAGSCPNATYVYIKPDLLGRKQLLAIGLAAHAAGKAVQFLGSCMTDPSYFEARYVITQ